MNPTVHDSLPDSPIVERLEAPALILFTDARPLVRKPPWAEAYRECSGTYRCDAPRSRIRRGRPNRYLKSPRVFDGATRWSKRDSGENESGPDRPRARASTPRQVDHSNLHDAATDDVSGLERQQSMRTPKAIQLEIELSFVD